MRRNSEAVNTDIVGRQLSPLAAQLNSVLLLAIPTIWMVEGGLDAIAGPSQCSQTSFWIVRMSLPVSGRPYLGMELMQ
jgi:hypothetical protein